MGLQPVAQKREPLRKREPLAIYCEIVELVGEPGMLKRLRHREKGRDTDPSSDEDRRSASLRS